MDDAVVCEARVAGENVLSAIVQKLVVHLVDAEPRAVCPAQLHDGLHLLGVKDCPRGVVGGGHDEQLGLGAVHQRSERGEVGLVRGAVKGRDAHRHPGQLKCQLVAKIVGREQHSVVTLVAQIEGDICKGLVGARGDSQFHATATAHALQPVRFEPPRQALAQCWQAEDVAVALRLALL